MGRAGAVILFQRGPPRQVGDEPRHKTQRRAGATGPSTSRGSRIPIYRRAQHLHCLPHSRAYALVISLAPAVLQEHHRGLEDANVDGGRAQGCERGCRLVCRCCGGGLRDELVDPAA
jgi:hypothetical protein